MQERPFSILRRIKSCLEYYFDPAKTEEPHTNARK